MSLMGMVGEAFLGTGHPPFACCKTHRKLTPPLCVHLVGHGKVWVDYTGVSGDDERNPPPKSLRQPEGFWAWHAEAALDCCQFEQRPVRGVTV